MPAVSIPIEGGHLDADLQVPEDPLGLVAFAHGSGSSRHSPRNRAVAQALHEQGLATLLVDLLTPLEEQRDLKTREHRFDLGLLATRLVEVLQWAAEEPRLERLPVGLFGASTGGGAALIAAVRAPDRVKAVVSRGGRPDLAAEALPLVRCPVLLLVGGLDHVVLELNRAALQRLAGPAELVVVPRATHLFEEPGALEDVALQAASWFGRYLP